MSSWLRPVASLIVCLPIASTLAAEPPSVEHFFRNPDLTDVHVSPDGRYLSAAIVVSQSKGARNIVLMDLDHGGTESITGYKDPHDVLWHYWLGNDWIAFSTTRGEQETGRYRSVDGVYVVHRDGTRGEKLWQNDLLQFNRGRVTFGIRPRSLRATLLLQYRNVHPRPWYRWINYSGKRLGQKRENDGTIVTWISDHRGRVDAAVAVGETGGPQLKVVLPDQDGFQSVLELGRGRVHGYDQDNRRLWVSLEGDERLALHRFDPHTREPGPVILEDDTYDVAGNLTFGDDGRLLAVSYHADRPKRYVPDDRFRGFYEVIDRALPKTNNRIVDWDEAMDRLLIFASSDRNPGDLYLYDVGANSIRFLLSYRPWIDPERMATVTPVRLEARDGLPLHGYLTLPPEHAGGPVSMILLVHGGPFVRDTWGFNERVQFLASRGYGVLQVNFRGSTGYGRAFEEAGYHQFGLAMQDDLTDAVHWAVEEGITESDRVCIMGGSYGGYATMMGLASTPELYQCGISIAGVYDLEAMYERDTTVFRSPLIDESMMRYWHKSIGDPEVHGERLRATSPQRLVADIQAPVMLVNGRADGRIPVDQYRGMLRALKRHDVEVEALQIRREGHGFHKDKNQFKLYRKIERFLAKHLPVTGRETRQAAAGSH